MRYVLIGLLFMSSTANAEDWQQIGKIDSNGGVLLVDAAGITEVQGFRRAWFKAVYTSDQLIPAELLKSVAANTRPYRSERTLRYFNCTERTGAVMRYYWKIADDEPEAHFYQALLTFRATSPGALDERMLETACNYAGEFADARAAKLRLPGEGAKMAKITLAVNPDEYYPSGSRRRKEQGSTTVQVCVGPDGTLLRQPIVTESSGYPGLDGAAINVARANRYAAGKESGKVLPESCLKFKVQFILRNR